MIEYKFTKNQSTEWEINATNINPKYNFIILYENFQTNELKEFFQL